MSNFLTGLARAATSDRGITTGVPHAPVRHTWGDMYDAAQRGAAVLQARGLGSGGAVAILAGYPVDVAPAAGAVWLAGGSVTMLQQPTARTNLIQYGADTLAALSMIGARIVIVGEPFIEVASMLTDAGFTAVTVNELAAGEERAAAVSATEDTVALLQLTSGSTAAPKAVEITHRNLWANITAMVQTAAIDPDTDVMVSWLPLFHDMGMVGFLTLPMCQGIELVKATPADFLAAPLSWMELIDHYRGTVTAAPNFAYALTARVLGRATNLDLSCLRFALNGAEPVDVAAVESFLSAGAPFGLSATAVVPAYGMAEATLGVSFHPWGTPLAVDTVDADALEQDRRAIPVVVEQPADVAAEQPGGTPQRVSNNNDVSQSAAAVREFPLLGPPLPGIEVEIRTGCGEKRAEREVGEIFIRGDAVTSRYLTATGPENTQDETGFLATGDSGYLIGDQVVVCGRLKDVIIMGGRNIYPTDIERAAHGVAGVRAGNAAAVRLAGTARREGFAVIVESRRSDDADASAEIAAAVRSAVTAQVGVRPQHVKVVAAGTLPKTPSGKIKRAAASALLAD